MPYQLTIKPKAAKALEKLNEPEYSAIKAAIYALADNPRPHGYIKLKGRGVTVSVWVTKGLSIMYLIIYLRLMLLQLATGGMCTNDAKGWIIANCVASQTCVLRTQSAIRNRQSAIILLSFHTR